MKRTDLVQLAIIIAGIFISYNFVSAIPSLLFTIYNWFENGFSGGVYMNNFLGTFILYGFYFAAAFFSIKKSKPLASWLCNKAGFEGEFAFLFSKNDLLFAIFIAIRSYGLIQSLPKLLVNAFTKIKSRNNLFADDTSVSGSLIATQLITVLLFFMLLYYAHVFADYFAAKVNNKEPDDEITEEKTD